MGSAIHITRAKEWTRSEEAPISVEEWRAAIAADPTLEADDDDETACDWQGHPDKRNLPLFRWASGRIVVEGPDDHTLGKALALARSLNAHVVGDDGEVHEDKLPRTGGAKAPLTDRQKLVRHALNRGFFLGAWVRRGLLPRPVRLTIHSTNGRDHFLIIVYRTGALRDVDERTKVDVVPLSAGLKIEPNVFLGRTVGFRLVANGERIAVRVKQPETWLRWLEHPEEPVQFTIT